MVILCLWDFQIEKMQLINNPDKTKTYIDKALIPMVKALENNDNLIAWEIINEPEWIWENRKFDKNNVIRFVAMIA